MLHQCFIIFASLLFTSHIAVAESVAPTEFSARIGGMGDYYHVALKDGYIHYTTYNGPPRTSLKIIKVTPEQWISFKAKLDDIAIWQWGNMYEPTIPITDGTSWKLNISYEKQHVESRGNNKYPEKFDTFLEAVETLTGHTFR